MPFKPLRLNLGCGSNKIEGFINIDVEPSVKPDIVCNFITTKLPYKTGSVDEVVLFHTIEHISKRFHPAIFSEIWRVLKPGASLIVSYPEFIKCVNNWKRNYKGQKKFWEATLYGRQLYPSDFHVALMNTPDFIPFLQDLGFCQIKTSKEPIERYNTVVAAVKGLRPPNYVDLIKNYMSNFQLTKGNQ